MKTLSKIALLLSIILSATLAYLIVSHYPDNHIGIDPQSALILLCMVTLVHAIISARLGTKWRYIAFGWVLMTIVASAVVDRCNFLVEYNSWTKRGMPKSGECKLF